MGILIAIVFLITFLSVRRNDVSQTLSIESSNTIKGVGILVVFFDHILQYLEKAECHYTFVDNIGISIVCLTTQLFVGIFLFLSGYGVYESIKTKGERYLNQIPLKRVINTLVNFNVAVIVYLIIYILINRTLPPTAQLIGSLIGWDSLGNSCWYIFCILCCYSITYFSFKLLDSKYKSFLLLLLCCLVYYACMRWCKEVWWYQTIFCYPAGILVSMLKNRILPFISKWFYSVTFLLLLIFVFSFSHASNSLLHNVASIAICCLYTTFTTRYRLVNPILLWCGKNLFPLYIYQRVPMIVISSCFPLFVKEYSTLFIICCMVISALIACIAPSINVISRLYKQK